MSESGTKRLARHSCMLAGWSTMLRLPDDSFLTPQICGFSLKTQRIGGVYPSIRFGAENLLAYLSGGVPHGGL